VSGTSIPSKAGESNDADSFGPSALMTPANLLTVIRILAAPIAFGMILSRSGVGKDHIASWPLLALWFALSMSDMADGALARRYGTTRSGAFLDPLADKVLVLGGLASVAAVGRFPWSAVILTAIRELGISGFRSYWGKRGLSVPASKLGKWKTSAQLGAVGWVTWPWFSDIHWLADTFLWVGVALAWISGVQYLIAGRSATSVTGS
jgi:CDP-diacylglycerol--glycerol-3-phosphate 3-phosphatidyltransferase